MVTDEFDFLVFGHGYAHFWGLLAWFGFQGGEEVVEVFFAA